MKLLSRVRLFADVRGDEFGNLELRKFRVNLFKLLMTKGRRRYGSKKVFQN